MLPLPASHGNRIYRMVIITGILYVLVGTAAACLFVYEHMFSQIRSMHVDTHDFWCVATEIDRSDCLGKVFGAMQR